MLTLYYPDIPERTHLRGNVYFDLVSEVAPRFTGLSAFGQCIARQKLCTENVYSSHGDQEMKERNRKGPGS